MKRKITTESHVKEIVHDWFKSVNGWSYAPIQNGMGVHGIPDRVGCVPVRITPDMVGRKVGVFVAVECKRPGRRGEQDRGMSKHQQMTLEAIDATGGFATCCDGYEDLATLHQRVFQQELALDNSGARGQERNREVPLG